MAPHRITLITLALAFVAVALAPTLAADHSYSHRVVVYGRVVDVEGVPVAGAQVNVQLDANVGGQCGLPPTTQAVTNDRGDYFWCYHAHAIESATYTVEVAGRSVTGSMDAGLRKARVDVALDVPAAEAEGASAGNASTDQTYRLDVFVWERNATTVEGVAVQGVAVEGHDVTAEFTFDGGRTETLARRTNAHGDARFFLDLGEPITGGTVRVSDAAGRSVDAPLDVGDHADMLVLRIDPEQDVDDTDDTTANDTGPQDVPALALVLGLLAVVGAAAFGRRG